MNEHPLYAELCEQYARFWCAVTERALSEPIHAAYVEGMVFPGANYRKQSVLRPAEDGAYEAKFELALAQRNPRIERSEGLTYAFEIALVACGIIRDETGLFAKLEHRREEYIARRIHKTLREGETGLSTAGSLLALHQAVHRIAPDINVVLCDEPLRTYDRPITAILEQIVVASRR
jgi:hypothetical protein